jgi:hypothetical protein
LWPRKSHPSRDSHQKGRRQQQVVAYKNPIHEGIPTKKAGDNDKLWPRKILSTKGFPSKNLYEDFEKMNA